jgi:transposase InsO family protein
VNLLTRWVLFNWPQVVPFCLSIHKGRQIITIVDWRGGISPPRPHRKERERKPRASQLAKISAYRPCLKNCRYDLDSGTLPNPPKNRINSSFAINPPEREFRSIDYLVKATDQSGSHDFLKRPEVACLHGLRFSTDVPYRTVLEGALRSIAVRHAGSNGQVSVTFLFMACCTNSWKFMLSSFVVSDGRSKNGQIRSPSIGNL